MKKTLFGVLLLILVLCLCACGATEEATEQAAEETEQAAEPAEDNTATDAKYAVELLDAQKLTNYEGEEVFAVFYNFTNNSEETVSATVALYVKAFQDGVQLDNGYLAESDLPEDKASTYDADYKEVRPGTTIQCYEEFKLTSTSDVEVEVTEFMSFDNAFLASQVYSVQ